VLKQSTGLDVSSGSGPVDGHPLFMSSYQSKLSGILASLYIIHRICNYYHLTSGKVTLFFDNKGAIRKAFQNRPLGITPYLTIDDDLLQLIQYLVQLLPIPLIGKWVKGHYTGKKREIQHDMNGIVDDLASRHLERPPKTFTPKKFPEAPPGYRVILCYDKSVKTLKYYSTLAKIHHDDQLKHYILRKTQWSATVFNKVSWKAHQRAFSRMTKFQQIASAKLVHNLANFNRQNILLYKSTPLCPLCNEYEETFQHVLQCREASALNHREAQLNTLETHLVNIQTPREIVRAILHGFREWQDSRQQSRAVTFGSVYGPDVLLTLAYHEQFLDI
jgi:hypothetical protein